MTSTEPVSVAPARGVDPRPTGRFAGWRAALNGLVLAFAVVAAPLNSRLWIDLRPLGTAGTWAFLVAWIASVLLLQCSFVPPRFRRWLRVPTYLMVAACCVNLIYFAFLSWADDVDQGPWPPCLFVAVMLVVWVRSFRNERPRWGVAGVATAAFFATGFGWLILIHLADAPPDKPVDVAVVLGHRVMEDGSASVTLRDRALAGAQLYRQGLVRYVMLSGSLDKQANLSMQSEVLAMRHVCLQAGVPANALVLDPEGVNTRATVYNTKALLARLGLHTVVGVSSNFHIHRVRAAFEEAGLHVATVNSKPVEWQQLNLGGAVRDLMGLVVYRFSPGYHQASGVPMITTAPRLVVHKAARTLELFDDARPVGERLVRTYACITGKHDGDKEREGDRKTPLGHFKICYKNAESKFHLSMGLDYPNAEDADRGLKEGLITPEQAEQIKSAVATGGIPNWYTPLGGEIFLHGHAEGRDHTAGCVALSNRDIEDLFALCDVGTPVDILP